MTCSVRTDGLEVAYEEHGPPEGDAVILLHGFPYDVRAYDEVAPALAADGCRVLVPWLRGYGETRFRDDRTPRSGEQAALGHDLLLFMDAVGVARATLAGFDWGGRAACVVAALWPDRVRGLVSCGIPYNIQDIAGAAAPAAPEQERRDDARRAAAPVVADERRPGDAERVHQREQVVPQRGLLAGARRPVVVEARLAVAAQPGHDHAAAVGRERRRDLVVGVHVVREAVQQDHRVAVGRPVLLVRHVQAVGADAAGHRRSASACRCVPWSSKLSGASQRSNAVWIVGHSPSVIENQAVSRLRPLTIMC